MRRVALALFSVFVVAAAAAAAEVPNPNPCNVKYDKQPENFCLFNPSKCADPKWSGIAARCNIKEVNPVKRCGDRSNGICWRTARTRPTN